MCLTLLHWLQSPLTRIVLYSMRCFRGGFTPRFGGNIEDKSVVGGLRGEIPFGSGLRYDVSYTYGRSDVNFFINNTINASLGPNTPRDFLPGGYSQIDNNINLDLGYSMPVSIFASDLDIAWVLNIEQKNS